MLWPETDDRRFKDPEQQLLGAMSAGELDEHLVASRDAMRQYERETYRRW